MPRPTHLGSVPQTLAFRSSQVQGNMSRNRSTLDAYSNLEQMQYAGKSITAVNALIRYSVTIALLVYVPPPWRGVISNELHKDFAKQTGDQTAGSAF